MVAVQCGQFGWTPITGNQFTVEFEISQEPRLSTGHHRERIWRLLNDLGRRDAWKLNDRLARTLPDPDQRYLDAFPPQAREWYLKALQPVGEMPSRETDVWFRYYDEEDARDWADFLSRSLPAALESFVADPTWFGTPVRG